jgi:hypothetical protein
LDREIRVGVLPEGPTGPDGEPLDGGYAQPAVAAVRFSGLRVVGRDSLERDSGRPWEFLGALMTPRGPIGREQAGSPAGHPDGVPGGCPFSSSGHPHRAPTPDRPPTKAGPAPAASCGCQQARNLPIALDDRAGQLRLLLRDRNAKFTAAFDAVFAAEATKVPITPVRAPRADASDVGHGDDGRQRPAGCLWRRHRRPAGDPDGDPQRPGDLGRLTRPDGLAGADRGRHRV